MGSFSNRLRCEVPHIQPVAWSVWKLRKAEQLASPTAMQSGAEDRSEKPTPADGVHLLWSRLLESNSQNVVKAYDSWAPSYEQVQMGMNRYR